jgi:hypothetical protein
MTPDEELELLTLKRRRAQAMGETAPPTPDQPQEDTRSTLQKAFQPITSAAQGAVSIGKELYNQAMEAGPQTMGAMTGGAIGGALGGPPGMAIGAGLGAGAVGTIERMAGTKPTAPTVGGQLAQTGLDIAGGVAQEAGPAIKGMTPESVGPQVTSGVQRQVMQAVKPRGNRPFFNQTIQRAVPEISDAAGGKQIQTMRDVYNIIPDAKKSVWDEYKAILQANDERAQVEIRKAKGIAWDKQPIEKKMLLNSDPSVTGPMQQELVDRTVTAQQALNKGVDALTIDGNEVADSMMNSVHPRTSRQDPALAERVAKLADTYRHRMDLQEAEQFLQGVNHELGPIYAQGPEAVSAAKNAPNTAHLFAEADSIRKQLYAKLDQLPGTNAAELKRRYGALDELQTQIAKRLPKIEGESPMSGLETLGWMGTAGKGGVELASGHPIRAAMTVGYPLAAKFSKYQNHPDTLIQKAFADYNAAPQQGLPPNWFTRLLPILARTQGTNEPDRQQAP